MNLISVVIDLNGKFNVVICLICKLILIVILYPILGTTIMASCAGGPPDAVLCAFCGISTTSYQLVLQSLSSSSCPPSFVTSEISSTSNELFKPTDYICSGHQDCFHFKNVQFQRGILISTTFKSEKSDDTKCCAKCGSESASIYRQIHSIKTVTPKDYIINWMNFEGKRVTRRRSGISEKDYLCSKCYVRARREKIAMHFSLVKKRRKNKSGGSSKNANSDGDSV